MLGGIVYYRLTEEDVVQITRRRTTSESIRERLKIRSVEEGVPWPVGAQAHIGNAVRVGQVFPMLIVRVGDGLAKMVSGQVFLDGTDVLWVQDIYQGKYFGQWSPSV